LVYGVAGLGGGACKKGKAFPALPLIVRKLCLSKAGRASLGGATASRFPR
jgi:hypothetical protein